MISSPMKTIPAFIILQRKISTSLKKLDNTVNINRFFELILKSFVNLGLGSEQDLQIIMFTHDEIVLNSMTRTMCKIGNGKFHFITGSLLDIEALNDKTDRKNNVYQLYDRIN